MSSETNGPDDMQIDWAAAAWALWHQQIADWDRAWDELAAVGMVDDRGGMEYRRRRLAWVGAGMPQPIQGWIVAQVRAEYEYVRQLGRDNPKTGG